MPLTKQEGDKRAMDYHYPLQHEIFNYQVCKFGKKPRVRGFEPFLSINFYNQNRLWTRANRDDYRKGDHHNQNGLFDAG